MKKPPYLAATLVVLMGMIACMTFAYAGGTEAPVKECPDCICEAGPPCPECPDCICGSPTRKCPDCECPEIAECPECPDVVCPEFPDDRNAAFMAGFWIGFWKGFFVHAQAY